MKTRLLITSILLISVCGAWLVPFIGILKYGDHLVQEPSLYILVIEILALLGMVVFAFSNLEALLRKK